MSITYDAIVLGAGMAGIPLALRLGFKGYKTALIEKADVGGTCLNRGCIPTKTMIASAKVAHQAREAARWGVQTNDVSVDLQAVVVRKSELVNSIRSGATSNLERNKNINFIRGQASFKNERTVEVDSETLTAEKIFIATGARNRVPGIRGIETVPYLDSTSMMELQHLPEHLLIVGGGYVGVEFAQMFRRFGVQVTVLQRAASLLPQEDDDITDTLKQALQDEGIEIFTEAEVITVRQDGRLYLTARVNGKEQVFEGSDLMIAAGRTANTDALNLAAAGIATNHGGFIHVNDRLETTANGIWALGDVRGGAMFTHTARDDARIVYENVVKGAHLSTQGRVVPYAIFSDPQLGRVGLNEKQARAAGYEVKIGRYEGRKVAKARALGEAQGLIKVVADGQTNKLLGASVLLADGGEVVHEIVAALQLSADYTDLSDMLHIHPTLAEGLSSALGGVHYEEGIS
jgi:dihydrolipoamide dehydrogenase